MLRFLSRQLNHYIRNDISFTLKIQTSDYVIWKRYSIEADFNSFYKPDKYGVKAQHTIWE